MKKLIQLLFSILALMLSIPMLILIVIPIAAYRWDSEPFNVFGKAMDSIIIKVIHHE